MNLITNYIPFYKFISTKVKVNINMMEPVVHNFMRNIMYNKNNQSSFALHLIIISFSNVGSLNLHLSGRNVFPATLNKRSTRVDVAGRARYYLPKPRDLETFRILLLVI